MGLDDGVADGQAHVHAPGLGREEIIEHRLEGIRRYAWSGVRNGDFDEVPFRLRGADRPCGVISRVEAVGSYTS